MRFDERAIPSGSPRLRGSDKHRACKDVPGDACFELRTCERLNRSAPDIGSRGVTDLREIECVERDAIVMNFPRWGTRSVICGFLRRCEAEPPARHGRAGVDAPGLRRNVVRYPVIEAAGKHCVGVVHDDRERGGVRRRRVPLQFRRAIHAAATHRPKGVRNRSDC